MAPSRKASRKGSQKDKDENKYETKTIESMSRTELENYAKKLSNMIESEKKEKNIINLEKNMISQFLETYKDKLEESQDQFMVFESKFEQNNQLHTKELIIYRQKVKHLIYEQYERWCRLKAEVTLEKEMQAKKFEETLASLMSERQILKERTKEKDLAHQHLMKECGIKSDQRVQDFREKYSKIIKCLEEKHELLTRQIMDYFSVKSKVDCLEIEEVKNHQIKELTNSHDKHFSDMRNYFNDITLNSLSLINNLKDQIENMKNKEERMEKQITELQQQNNNLVTPLNEANTKLTENKKKLSNWENLKRSLKLEELKVKKLTKEFQKSTFEGEALRQKLKMCEDEKSFYKLEYSKLEKASHLNDKLNEIVHSRSSEMHLGENSKDVEAVLGKKNYEIKELKEKLRMAKEAHDSIVEMHENFKDKMGYRTSECEMKPLII